MLGLDRQTELALRPAWYPLHVSDMLCRPEMVFRRAVAIEAKLHGERYGHVNLRHQIDAPMAAHTPDVAAHVRRMVEEHEIWHIEHSIPLDGFAIEEATAYLRQYR